jgi:tetratricopeptide (TPR) repeat protein
MPKKKRKSAKKAGQGPSRSEPRGFDLPPIDWRSIERVMQEIVSGTGGGDPETPLDQAQEIIYDALEEENREQRMALAKKALKVSPDCADAYVILAEGAATLDEALRLNAEGVAAGERALGNKAFKEYSGRFWGVLETRPYMRARLGLAQCLWAAGRHEEAVAHYRELLRLNPDDNQGVRYLLAESLLDLNWHEELQRLLKTYGQDGSADWTYTRALLAFRQEGDTEKSRRLLRAAAKGNRHVPEYLVGNVPMPRELPDYVGSGDEDEAVAYAADSLSAWKGTPGAITWLRKVLKVALPEPPPPRRPPWPRLKQKLLQLEQIEGEVWQVDARPLAPVQASEDGPPPWGVFVTSRTDDAILVFDIEEKRPGPNAVWDYVVEAMLQSKHGPTHRPAGIEVRLKSFQKAWAAKLQQIGIECRLCDTLEQIDEMVGKAALQLDRQRQMAESGSEEFGDLAELPQHVGETWQADVRHLATWVEGEGELLRPWSVLVINRSDDLVLAQDLTLEEPTPEWFMERVRRAIQQPLVGEPHRPGVIEVRSEAYRDLLKTHLDPVDVECVLAEQLDQLDTVYRELAKHFAGPNAMAALVEVPGVSAVQVGSYFAAAAEFYRRAPWRLVAGEVPIEVRTDKFQSGPWYAVVMGQSGMTLGLALYEDRQVLSEILTGAGSDEENFRRTSAISLTFGEAFEMAPADLDAAERHGWEIAGPEAYPCAMRVNPGNAVRPPLAWELELLAGVLRAIPDFLARKEKNTTVTVPAAAGELTLELTLLAACRPLCASSRGRNTCTIGKGDQSWETC